MRKASIKSVDGEVADVQAGIPSLKFGDEIDALWFTVGYNAATGREADSIEALRSIIKLDPGCAAAFYGIGRIYLEQGENIVAEYFLACAAELDGSRPEIAFAFGTCLAMNGYYQRSITWLREALKNDPEHVTARFNLGMSYLFLGNENKAMTTFSKVLEIAPDHLPSAYNLGIFFLRSKMPQRAGHYFTKCLAVNPRFVEAWQLMFRVFLHERNLVAAEKVLKRGLEELPDNKCLRVDRIAFENFQNQNLKEGELVGRIKRALKDLPELVPDVLERVMQFRQIMENAEILPIPVMLQ